MVSRGVGKCTKQIEALHARQPGFDVVLAAEEICHAGGERGRGLRGVDVLVVTAAPLPRSHAINWPLPPTACRRLP